jgi:hypothetical protein
MKKEKKEFEWEKIILKNAKDNGKNILNEIKKLLESLELEDVYEKALAIILITEIGQFYHRRKFYAKEILKLLE